MKSRPTCDVHYVHYLHFPVSQDDRPFSPFLNRIVPETVTFARDDIFTNSMRRSYVMNGQSAEGAGFPRFFYLLATPTSTPPQTIRGDGQHEALLISTLPGTAGSYTIPAAEVTRLRNFDSLYWYVQTREQVFNVLNPGGTTRMYFTYCDNGQTLPLSLP